MRWIVVRWIVVRWIVVVPSRSHIFRLRLCYYSKIFESCFGSGSDVFQTWMSDSCWNSKNHLRNQKLHLLAPFLLGHADPCFSQQQKVSKILSTFRVRKKSVSFRSRLQHSVPVATSGGLVVLQMSVLKDGNYRTEQIGVCVCIWHYTWFAENDFQNSTKLLNFWSYPLFSPAGQLCPQPPEYLPFFVMSPCTLCALWPIIGNHNVWIKALI